MHNDLDICVTHKGALQCFPAVFSRIGYSYRIVVTVQDTPVIFEPDEERQWRVRTELNQQPAKEVTELIPLIAAELEMLLK